MSSLRNLIKHLSICSAADKRSTECVTKYVHQYKRNTQCIGPCSSGCIQADVSNGWSDLCVSNSVTVFGSGAFAFQRRSQSKVKHKGKNLTTNFRRLRTGHVFLTCIVLQINAWFSFITIH